MKEEISELDVKGWEVGEVVMEGGGGGDEYAQNTLHGTLKELIKILFKKQ